MHKRNFESIFHIYRICWLCNQSHRRVWVLVPCFKVRRGLQSLLMCGNKVTLTFYKLFIMEIIIIINKPLTHRTPDQESFKIFKSIWWLHKFIGNNTFKLFWSFQFDFDLTWFSEIQFRQIHQSDMCGWFIAFNVLFRNSKYLYMNVNLLTPKKRKVKKYFCIALSEKLEFHAKFNEKHNENNNLCSIYGNSHEIKYIHR